jgi:hypothetical protein
MIVMILPPLLPQLPQHSLPPWDRVLTGSIATSPSLRMAKRSWPVSTKSMGRKPTTSFYNMRNANRLTENSETTVLLLEASNPDTKPEIQIPAECLSLLGSEVDWAYFSEPEPYLND